MVERGVWCYLLPATLTNVVLRCVENSGHSHEFSVRLMLQWKAGPRPLFLLKSVPRDRSLDRGAISEGNLDLPEDTTQSGSWGIQDY